MKALHPKMRFVLIGLGIIAFISPFWFLQSDSQTTQLSHTEQSVQSEQSAQNGNKESTASSQAGLTGEINLQALPQCNALIQSNDAQQPKGSLESNKPDKSDEPNENVYSHATHGTLPSSVLSSPNSNIAISNTSSDEQTKAHAQTTALRDEPNDHINDQSHTNVQELLDSLSKNSTANSTDPSSATQTSSTLSQAAKTAQAQAKTNEQSQNKGKNLVDGKGQTDAQSHQIADSKQVTENLQDNLSLQQQVDKIVQQKTTLEKAQYAKDLNERENQVNWAVSTIKDSSTIYLADFLSKRGVIVYFGVDVKRKNKPDNDTDITTGPTKLAFPAQKDNGTLSEKSKVKFEYGSGVIYIAKMLHEESGASLYNIATVDTYPREIENLFTYASDQQFNNIRPELTDDQSLDISQFDTIYLCYTIWWQDMPMPVYSFLDKYDLSGKLIIPICLSRDNGFYNTLDKIAAAEPNAQIQKEWLIKPTQLADLDFRQTMRDWLEKLNQDLN